ncbi:MAG TPA: CHAT domain-containing protein [Pseudonocardiaceae bacterium]
MTGTTPVAGTAPVRKHDTPVGDLVAVATSLCTLASRDPVEVLRRAGHLLEIAGRHTELRVLARHAACLAHVERGEPDQALRHARLALRAARRAGLEHRIGQLRLTTAGLELERNGPAAGLAQVALAHPDLRGEEAARAWCLRGLHLIGRGDHVRAHAALVVAVEELRRTGGGHWLAVALNGRGAARAYLGRPAEADTDFAAAAAVWFATGRTHRALACLHNRGFAAVVAGDLPRALELFERARQAGLDPERYPESLVDEADALLAAGLLRQAEDQLRHAVRLLAAAGRWTKLADAQLALADCMFRASGPARVGAAAALATEVTRRLRRQGRTGWAVLATALRTRCLLDEIRARNGAAGTWPRRRRLALLRRVAAVAAECEHHGWWAAGAELRVEAAAVAHDCGFPGTEPVELLAPLVTGRSPVPVRLRALRWVARARAAALRGEYRRALAACRHGVRLAVEHGITLDAVRSRAVRLDPVTELTGIALDVVLERARRTHGTGAAAARTVLRWSELRHEAGRVHPAVRPPRDRQVAAALAELRAAAVRERCATGGGRDAGPERSAVIRHEQRVRRLLPRVDGGTGTGERNRRDRGLSGPDLREVSTALDGAALLSFCAHRGSLIAVSVTGSRVRLHEIGPLEQLARYVELVRFAARLQVARAGGTRLPLQAPAGLDRGAARAADVLDRMLFGRLRSWLGDRPLVVVPDGPLRALPWSVLPSCTGRPLTLAPSVGAWTRAHRRAARPGRGAVWVAGPGLAHAAEEVLALHRVGGGRLLLPAAARTGSVLRALDGADVGHLAVHGRFREDHPLFSTVELQDGPLYGYDLHRLRRAPRLVVLSACEGARCDEPGGGPLLGLAAVLLERGCAVVVGSVLPVPDERVPPLMADLHRGVRAGRSPAEALAEAQARHGHHGFVCLGAGTTPLRSVSADGVPVRGGGACATGSEPRPARGPACRTRSGPGAASVPASR